MAVCAFVRLLDTVFFLFKDHSTYHKKIQGGVHVSTDEDKVGYRFKQVPGQRLDR